MFHIDVILMGPYEATTESILIIIKNWIIG